MNEKREDVARVCELVFCVSVIFETMSFVSLTLSVAKYKLYVLA